MKHAVNASLLLLLTLLVQNVQAQDPGPRQEPAELRSTIETFLQKQTADLPGKVKVVVGQIDPRTNLASCPTPEAFLPTGSRAWGKTTVGVRCLAPTPWTVYVQSNVIVTGDYIAAAVPLSQGQVVAAQHLKRMTGELTNLPPSIVTDESQALGRTLVASVNAGTPLRADALRSQMAVQQGQAVKLVSIGPGFKVSAEARAMANANEGQMVQVKTMTGQQISGIAKIGGLVEVTY